MYLTKDTYFSSFLFTVPANNKADDLSSALLFAAYLHMELTEKELFAFQQILTLAGIFFLVAQTCKIDHKAQQDPREYNYPFCGFKRTGAYRKIQSYKHYGNNNRRVADQLPMFDFVWPVHFRLLVVKNQEGYYDHEISYDRTKSTGINKPPQRILTQKRRKYGYSSYK